VKGFIKPFDIIVLLILAGLTVFSVIPLYSRTGSARRLTIKSEGRNWVFPLDAEETVIAAGPLGNTVVEMKNGRARIVSSPCQNQICIAAGPVHSHGQWIACLPNRVMVSVSRGDGEVDGTAW
jgi:hypothetical protein